jgi:hypothetical protein
MKTVNCLSVERLAAAAAGEDREATAHALECPACRARFDEQRALRRLAGALTPPPLTAPARDRLTDGVMARVALSTPNRHRVARVAWVAAAALVLCATGWLASDRGRWHPTSASVAPGSVRDGASDTTGDHGSGSPAGDVAVAPSPPVPRPDPGRPAVAASPPISEERRPDGGPVLEPAAPHRSTRVAAAKVSGPKARFGRAMRDDRDVVELNDGEVTIDARDTAPVELRLGATAIRVADAKATVTARTGAIASVVVFAGSVELSSGAHSTVVMAGTVWLASKTTDRAGSMVAFQAGWAALRRGEFGLAIAEFDRAIDPVIREEAAFWAAVAARRAGQRAAARRRFTEFLDNFPFSSRADAARREIAADHR